MSRGRTEANFPTRNPHLRPPSVPALIPGPVFIVGCGRSGTTILGRTLSCHPEVTYLNERRDLWIRAYPESDIWSENAAGSGGVLVMTAANARSDKSQMLRTLFHEQTLSTGRPVLVEKLPINSFRLELIHSIFPQARFVYILREGRSVARSIAGKVSEGWFGWNDYKWSLLLEHARKHPETADLAALCRSDYERGLLEWRLSTDAARQFFDQHPTRCLEIRYEDLTKEPTRTVSSVLEYLRLAPSDIVTAFAFSQIAPPADSLSPSPPLSPLERRIGGPLLKEFETRDLASKGRTTKR